jgi:hypothetical protein
VVIFAAGFLPLAGRADADPATLSPIRREMLAEYRYTPEGTPLAKLPTSLHSDAPAFPVAAGTDADVLQMDRYEVLESRDAVWPHETPAAPAAPGPPATVASKLGIGIHRVQVGKVELFATTVFYIPVLVGFAW